MLGAFVKDDIVRSSSVRLTTNPGTIVQHEKDTDFVKDVQRNVALGWVALLHTKLRCCFVLRCFCILFC